VIDGRSVQGGAAVVSSVEQPIASLTKVARSPQAFARPPLCEVTGPGVPAQALDVESWVVTGLSWGAAERNADGTRTRQEATLTFMEYVEPDTALSKIPNVTGRPGAKYRVVKVGKFRDLSKLSAHYLKKANRWREIAKLNGIRGTKIPAKIVKANKIRIPLR
jgi:nucleoid-associated protein YgaU